MGIKPKAKPKIKEKAKAKTKAKTKFVMSPKSALSQVKLKGPYFTSNLFGDVICRYCELNRTAGGKNHKKGCPWPIFKEIKI